MGYTLTIGEMKTHFEDNGEIWHSVAAMCLDDAPINSNHDRKNLICPCYSSWGDFMRTSGLNKALEEHGITLMAHSGVCFISRRVRDVICNYGQAWLQQHPVVRIEGVKTNTRDDLFADYNPARMRWLVWWVNWAFENCKTPVFQKG